MKKGLVVLLLGLSLAACKENGAGSSATSSAGGAKPLTAKKVEQPANEKGALSKPAEQKTLLRQLVVAGDHYLHRRMSNALIASKVDFRANNCFQYVSVQQGGSAQERLEIFDQPCPADGSAIQTEARLPLVLTELPQSKIASNVHKYDATYWYHGVPYWVGRLEAYNSNPKEAFLKGLCQWVEEGDSYDPRADINNPETGLAARCTITFDAGGRILNLELP